MNWAEPRSGFGLKALSGAAVLSTAPPGSRAEPGSGFGLNELLGWWLLTTSILALKAIAAVHPNRLVIYQSNLDPPVRLQFA